MNRVGLSAALGLFALGALAQPQLKVHETPYYELHTDLAEDDVRAVTHRLTLLAEEYHRRTEGLGGAVRERLPFFLFGTRADYEKAGGRRGTAGVYTGRVLAAVADAKQPEAMWYTIQHEGFHQFVHATIGLGLPIWANEGLAEYFAEGIFTGDEFYTGLVSPERLARLKAQLKDGELKSVRAMMQMSNEAWATDLRGKHYDQAWSLVHFLAHADNEQYQTPFFNFLRDVSRGQEWERAWLKHFGGDVEAFAERWRAYWLGLPADPTADLFAQTVVSTLTSFLARAASQLQSFDDVDEFFAVARHGELKAHRKDWLPPDVLERALAAAPRVGEWSLGRRSGQRVLTCTTPRGTVLEGTFRTDSSRVKSVTVSRGR